MQFTPLASSSSGNCILLSEQNTHILIDCGISGKAVKAALDCAGVNGEDIRAIIVTHEHSDHIKGLGILSRKYNIPIYANSKTWSKMGFLLGNLAMENIHCFQNDTPFLLHNIRIQPFPIPHDAADPVGFNFWNEQDVKCTLATDIGHLNDDLFNEIKGSKKVLLESNHDVEMLKNGSYYYGLKQRILGELGHLSNDNAARLACRLVQNGTEQITLAHLSCENNTPQIAHKTVCSYLKEQGIKEGSDVKIEVAPKMKIV
jgi:Metal-dependent hydrolases of the beta-lactamase superfamily I